MSSSSDFERVMRDRLTTQLGERRGQDIYAQYSKTKADLVPIWEAISRVETDLSDHGPRHIENVLTNVYRLLGEETNYFSGIELYCLGVSVLFHDVGNLKGRHEHQRKVAEIYDAVRPQETYNAQEKVLVLRVIGAHSGFALDGSKDTLKDLGSTLGQLEGEGVQLQSIAAVLRFADELAEGLQRTSVYMLNRNMFSPGSELFHKYAQITSVHIDRGSSRVALQYNISVAHSKGVIATDDLSALKQLLSFAYQRILKLEQERRYNKYYSEVLGAFTRTEASFTFLIDHEVYMLNVPPIILTDLVLPDEINADIPKHVPEYETDNLCQMLIDEVSRRES